MALAEGLAAALSGFTAALGLGSSSGFAFAEALLIGARVEAGEAGMDKGVAWLFATFSLPVFAVGLLLLDLPGLLTLLLDFVLTMTKAHQKGV